MKKIKLRYTCSEKPGESFLIIFKRDKKCSEVLEGISKKQNVFYNYLFYEDIEIDKDDNIIDYWEDDPEYYFYASVTCDPKYKPLQGLKPKRNYPEISCPLVNYTFYFTGNTKTHLLKGVKVYLIYGINFEACHKELIELLQKNKVNIKDKQLILYFPGGIPFISGNIEDFYSKNKNVERIIYGVLIRNISEDVLGQYYDNVFDARDSVRKSLISPLCDSTNRGISDVACLLGYLSQEGEEKDHLIKSLACRINFAPFITSLYKIYNHDKLTGLNIATICSTLFTYFRDFIPNDKVADKYVFEYTYVFLYKIMADFTSEDRNLPILTNIYENKIPEKSKLQIDCDFYCWGVDFGGSYPFLDIINLSFDWIEEKKIDFTSSILVDQSKINSTTKCVVIKGKTHEYMYVKKSPTEILLIDPIPDKNKPIFIIEQQSSNDTKNSQKEPIKDQNYFIDEEEEKEFHIFSGKIGEGATSVAYKIIDKRTKEPICKKVLKYREGQTTIKDAKHAMNEFYALYSISHPCICKAIGINISESLEIINKKGEKEDITTIALFLEYIEYGLKEILNSNINNTLKTRIVLDIVHAMNFIHKKGMMHRDLKIENIMINEFFETKIVDFGLVKITELVLDDFSYVEDSITKGVGTFAYMSPEMMNEEDYDNKTDVYSFGIVLHVIFTGKLPKQSIKDKVNGNPIDLPSPSKSISSFCIQLISKCLENSPSKRPSFEDILKLMRENSYELADNVNPSILKKRDDELTFIENNE